MHNDKKRAAAWSEKSNGARVLRGHHAVDPRGHLVLLRPGEELPGPNWRWATDEDHKAAAAAEAVRVKDAAPTRDGPIK
jgi:hypothetical protein